MTPINYIRGRADPLAQRPRRSGLVFTALAILVSLLCVTAILLLRGGGGLMAPPVGVAKVTVPVTPPPRAADPAPAVVEAARPPPAPRPAPAPVTVDRTAKMLATLSQARGSVTLAVEDDPQAQATGRRLADLFRDAGWTVTISSVFGAGSSQAGLSAALADTPPDRALAQAFAEAGVKLGPPPPTAGIVQTPEIFVGGR